MQVDKTKKMNEVIITNVLVCSFNPIMIQYTDSYFVLRAFSIILFTLAVKLLDIYFNVTSRFT